MSFKYWTKVFVFVSISYFLFTSIFNYIINPYSIFEHKLFSSYLKIKGHTVSERMLTFYSVTHANPKNLMLGTSRIGIFPTSAVEKYLGNGTHNMTIPGANIEEQISYLRYMAHKHQVKNVVWALDFFSFNPDLQNDPSFSYDRVDPFTNLKSDHLIALFSLQALGNSAKTLIDNIKQKDKDQDLNIGFKKAQEKANLVYSELTHEQIVLATKVQLNYYSKKFLKHRTFNNPKSIQKNLQNLQEVLVLCKEKGINVYLYTSPVQDSFLDLYKSLGLQETFLAWKKGIAEISSYTDFCNYNSISEQTDNFIDGTHIQANFGDLIFARIFQDKSVKVPEDFGIYIQKQ